jgi:UDP-2-acetamido-2,6-beta-L-arabino-hexul-4-ose reductase
VAGNVDLTQALCRAVGVIAVATGKKVPVVYTSSTQADRDNAYGASKLGAENALFELQRKYGVPVHVFRLPNVFGKWCKPNFNSVVATFCHNISRNLPVQINDAFMQLTLVHVEDVISCFLQVMDGSYEADNSEYFKTVSPQFSSTIGELARLIQSFKETRETLMTDRVGDGFLRALYSTYVSYLPVESFAYSIHRYADKRGDFVEILKTPDCGQISYFTSLPGSTRGGHYHNIKTEKFLVIKGEARFKFKHMQTGELHEVLINGDISNIVESVPGWAHEITNIGKTELIVMLWSNEVFQRERPDTIACDV